MASWLTVKSISHSQLLFNHGTHTERAVAARCCPQPLTPHNPSGKHLQVLNTAQLLHSFNFLSHCAVFFLVSLFLTHLSLMKHKRGAVCQSYNSDLFNELPWQTNPEWCSTFPKPSLCLHTLPLLASLSIFVFMHVACVYFGMCFSYSVLQTNKCEVHFISEL